MRYKGFKPVSGVTLENSIRHLAAVEEAVVRDIRKVEPSQRQMVLRLIRSVVRSLDKAITRLIGEAGGEDSAEQHAFIYAKLHPPGDPN